MSEGPTFQDRHYTPRPIADLMVATVRKRSPKIVADFAAGHGELLQAAVRRWKDVIIVGTDIDAGAIPTLRKQFSHQRFGKCDFLNPRSRAHCHALQGDTPDVVLLNPPFSFRGGTRHTIQYEGDLFRCTPALSFLAISLSYLSPRGELVALLPASIATSETGHDLWELISKQHSLKVISRHDTSGFRGCRARTLLVRLRRGVVRHDEPICTLVKCEDDINVQVVRGVVPVHTLNGDGRSGRPLIHTTDLQDGTIGPGPGRTNDLRRSLSAPAVLLPRVCAPMMGKVCLYESGREVVPSDCVIGLECSRVCDAREVFDRIRNNWILFSRAYDGTCAQYTTVQRLQTALGDLGVLSIARVS